MKYFHKSLIIIVLTSLILVSCDKEEMTPMVGNLEFSMLILNNENVENGRLSTDDAPKKILLSIKSLDGKTNIDKKVISLYNFQGEFLSEPIALEIGDYELTEFLVMDEDDNILYVAPKTNSNLEHLVKNPLPLKFSITQDLVEKIVPEVIKIEGLQATDFGYSTFSFEMVDTFSFLISVMVYDPAIQDFKLTPADLDISYNASAIYNLEMEAKKTDIRLAVTDKEISLKVSKEGYHTFELMCSQDSLAYYLNTPLIVTLFKVVDLTDGLVAYYPLNNSIKDGGQNELDGVSFGNGYGVDRKGNEFGAATFDGLNDYIKVENNELFENQQFTLSVWVKSDQIEGGILSMSIPPNNLNNCGPYLKIEDNMAAGLYYYQNYDWIKAIGTTTITNDNWHHIAYTYDGAVAKVYVDGVPEAATASTHYINYNEHNPVIIGAYASNSGGTWFNGSIDDVRIYNKAVTLDGVMALKSE